MAYASSAVASPELVLKRVAVRRQPGFFGRILAAMMLSRQRQAEREIAHYLINCGGKFTDEAEREIERRFLSAPSSPTHW